MDCVDDGLVFLDDDVLEENEDEYCDEEEGCENISKEIFPRLDSLWIMQKVPIFRLRFRSHIQTLFSPDHNILIQIMIRIN